MGKAANEPYDEEAGTVPVRPQQEEQASWWSRMTFSFMYPLLQFGTKEVVTERNLADCHSNDRATEQSELLLKEWSRRTAAITAETYKEVMQRVQKADANRALIPDPSAWDPLMKRVEAGEFKTFADSQFFYEGVEAVVKAAYKAADPTCPLCAKNRCPLAKGAPKVPGMPEASKTHKKLAGVVEAIMEAAKSGEPDLMATVMYLLRWDMVIAATWGTFQTLGLFVSIYLLPELVKVLGKEGEDRDPVWKGYVWCGVVLVCAVFVAVAMGQQYTWCTRLSNRIRAMLAATIHKKSLVLSTNGWQAMGGHGKIFNLLNTDCETIFQRAYNVTAQAMSYPAQIILAIAFLAYLLSWPVVVGTVVMLACFRYNYLLGLELMDCFVSRMVKSDARVKKQHEFLENIHAVKYFAWEEHFLEQINKERQEEIGSVKRLLVGLAKLLFASNLGPYTFQVSILVVAAAWDESMLTTTTIFQAIALTSILRTSFTTAPMLYSQYFTILSAFSRIQDFLMKDERRFRPFKGSDGEIHVKNTEFAWKRNRPVLRGVNLHVKRGELVMVVGRVGCGKSSLLEGLLGEMNMNHDGELSVGGGVAYCPQAPWVFNGTLKDNILWKRPDYEGRYKRILRAAELTEDLKTLPHGENTEIGEKGINLSGGQKARVSLARAVYADEDIYFLDDPLSAVDAFVAKKLFDNVICGQLKRKTRIMVTNQLQFLSKADRIFSVTKDGRLMEEDLAAGYHPPADPAQRTVLQQLLVEFQSKVASRAGILGDVSVVLAAAVAAVGALLQPHADFGEGSLSLSQSDCSSAGDPDPRGAVRVKGDLIEEEAVEVGDVTFKTYKRYMKYYGGVGFWTFLVVAQLLALSIERMSFIWLGWYTNEDSEQSAGWYKGHIITGDHHTAFWFGIYAAFLLVTSLLIGLKEMLFSRNAEGPSREMCADHLRAVADSPMHFFDTTPAGRILTRFTFDWMSIDMQVPMMLGMSLTQFGALVASLLFITVSVPWFALGYPILFATYWYVTRMDRTALQLRRIFNKTKSPVTDTFGSTLHGLSTIRAFQRESDMVQDECVVIDINTSAYSAERLAFEWVRLRVNLVGAVVTTAVYVLVIIFRDSLTPATAGLMVAQGSAFASIIGLAFLMRQQLEMAMNSIERILEHCRLPPEETAAERAAAVTPPPEWPQKGEITISGLSLRYRPNLPLVLNDVNVHIEGGWRVGICGRTGGGKSTILKALFRLMRFEPGSKISIDGVDATKLQLKTLRRSMAIIPQEPVVLDGTVRYNLDPFGENGSEEAYRDALQGCNLDGVLREKAEAQGVADVLDLRITSETLSIGQRQLLCLGRALVLRKKVLLLDEATANVDVVTDGLIQETLRTRFAGVTQLVIAHRLHTIIDCDRILVMAGGRAVQYDAYENLVADVDGVFRSLAEEAGLVRKL